jgi:hypothetical protein
MRVMSTDEDAKLIAELGGPAKVAKLLGYGDRGTQRVHNWLTRGIPPKVKLERPDLFLRKRKHEAAAADRNPPEPSMWPMQSERRLQPRREGPSSGKER